MQDQQEKVYTRQQVEQLLNVPYSTLRVFIEDLKAIRTSQGRELRKGGDGGWRFSDEDLEDLRRAQALAAVDGRTHASIIRVLSTPLQRETTPDMQLNSNGAAAALHETSKTETVAELTHLVDVLQQLVQVQAGQAVNPEHLAQQVSLVVAPQLVEALAKQTELAEKYAHAAHRVGQLESTVQHVTADRDRILTELQQAQRALTAPMKPWWKVWG